MAFKKIKILFLIIFLANQSEGIAQSCGTIERNIEIKTRKYYLLDSNCTLALQEVLKEVKPEDTVLIKQIIENGTKDEDYKGFFKKRGVEDRTIGLDHFTELPWDTVVLTKREVRLNRKYKRLIEKETELIIAGKSNKSLNERTGKPKFIHLHDKLLSSNPILFKMYPIYRYNNHELIIYGVFTSLRVGIAFNYDLCIFE